MRKFKTVHYEGVVHGDQCNTKTYPTRCKYCQETVFYFSCDHGCKVFFDELDKPWPVHRCPEYLKHVRG